MTSATSVSVRLQGVGKIFSGDVEAVRNIDLSFSSGRVVALLGPTGCGKTTILRLIGGLEEPTSGTVECHPQDSVIGYCFQEPRLLPWRTVRGNVGLPLELQGVAESQREKAIDSVLGMVGLQDASDRFPAALSGGMQMRTSLARSLVCEPELLLLDEPFAALDEVTRLRLDEEVSALVRRRGITTLIVTHSITEAVFIADEIVVLSPHPGQVHMHFDVPFDERVAALRGSPEFAALTAKVYDSLCSVMGDDQ